MIKYKLKVIPLNKQPTGQYAAMGAAAQSDPYGKRCVVIGLSYKYSNDYYAISAYSLVHPNMSDVERNRLAVLFSVINANQASWHELLQGVDLSDLEYHYDCFAVGSGVIPAYYPNVLILEKI